MRFEDGLDRLFLRRVDEGASIDDEHVGFVRVTRDLHPTRENSPEHEFRIDEILGAAKADHADFFGRSGGGGQGGSHR